MTLLKDYLAEVKKQRSRGRCLHYNSSNRCNKIISAHSIQESGQLRLIEEDGHVYSVGSNISTLKKSGGRPQISRIGVNKVSTFDGFCQRHDNELFKLIDNNLLVPNAVQIALYAYRCLCCEYFVKENAVRTFKKFLNHDKMSKRLQKLISDFHQGSVASFARLQDIKTTFDKDIREPMVGPYYENAELGIDQRGSGKYRMQGAVAGLVYLFLPLALGVNEEVRFEKINP